MSFFQSNISTSPKHVGSPKITTFKHVVEFIEDKFSHVKSRVITSERRIENFLTQGYEVILIAIFFGEDVGNVVGSWDVVDIYKVAFDILSNSIITQLNVTNATCHLVFAPLDPCRVVIEYVYWFG